MRDDALPVVLDDGKDFCICLETDDGAVQIRVACLFYLRDRLASLFVFLRMLATIAVHFCARPYRECVDHGGADAVETAGDLVAFAAEFAAGVQSSHDGLKCRYFRLLMDVDWDAAAVVGDTHFVLRQKRYLDIVRKPSHRFVTRVVEYLPNEVMEAVGAGRADIHAGAATHRFKPLEDGNVRGSIGACFLHLCGGVFCLCCSHGWCFSLYQKNCACAM